MIFTFYSYKGGVGRSMALANVADLLARRGLRVLMVDFDLEAPGLEQFFPINLPKARRHPGLLDLLLSYKESMSMGGDSSTLPPFKQLQEHFILPVYDQLPKGGRLDLLPAGQREEEHQLARYALNLRTFDWQDFFFNWAGEMFFEWLRRTLVPDLYDVVLVDSRTGVTEMGGICAYQLSDVIVMLCAANQQNLEGTHSVVENFFSERVQELRQHRPLQVLVVPARVEQRDDARLEGFREKFERLFGGRTPPRLAEAGLDLWRLMIPYEPRYAFDEQVVSRPRGQEERREVAAAFHLLVESLTILAGPETVLGRTRRTAAAGGPGSHLVPAETVQFDVTRRHAGYHAVLSYHRDDRDEMERVARALENHGVRLFLDCWEGLTGEDWRARTEEALFHSTTLLVGIGAEGLTAWQSEQMRIASSLRDEGMEIIPILLSGAEAVPGQFSSESLHFRASDLRDEKAEAVSLLASVLRSVSPSAPHSRVDHGPPYVGLQAFGEQHASIFFGRDRLIGVLQERVQTERFIAVVGPSGCGKSSLVHAGLFPALRRGEIPGSDRWSLLTVRPGSQPLQSLARGLCSLKPSLSVEEVAARLESGERSLVEIAEQVLSEEDGSQSAGRRLILFVDHFEDLYTLKQDQARQTSFVANLMYAAAQQRGPVTTVVAIRGDFFSRFGEHPTLTARLQENLVLVPTLTPEELRLVVEEPARRVGLAFEPGLAERIVAELAEEPGALPLLQFLLLQLWEKREEGWLTNAAYHKIGGVRGALGRQAERVYRKLPPEQQAIAPRILLRLIRSWDGRGGTRRVATLAELLPAAGEAEHFRATIRRLSNARLLIVGAEEGETTVELAHESLISGWPRLQQWLKDDHEFLTWQQRMQLTLAQARHLRRDESAYLRGAPLEEARRWMRRRPKDLSAEEHRYIRRSVARKRARDFARVGIAVVLILLTVAASAFAVTERRQREEATKQKGIADNQTILARARQDSILYEQRLTRQASDSAIAARMRWQAAAALAISKEAEARRERDLAQHATETARREAADAKRASEQARIAQNQAQQAAQRAHNAKAVLQQTVEYLSRRAVLDYVPGQAGTHETAASTAAHGPRRVTIESDGTARLSDPIAQVELGILQSPNERFTSAVFSPNADLIATTSESGTLFLWYASNGTLLARFTGHSGRIRNVVFAPDQRWVATASDDSTAIVWDIRKKDREQVLRHGTPVIDVGFTGGESVVTTGSDGTHRVWTLRRGPNSATVQPGARSQAIVREN